MVGDGCFAQLEKVENLFQGLASGLGFPGGWVGLLQDEISFLLYFVFFFVYFLCIFFVFFVYFVFCIFCVFFVYFMFCVFCACVRVLRARMCARVRGRACVRMW